MRLEKRDRLILRLKKRNLRRAARNAKREQEGAVSIAHNSFVARNGGEAVPVGTANVGSNLLRYSSNKEKPTYAIEREPRLSSRPVKSGQVKRFGNL